MKSKFGCLDLKDVFRSAVITVATTILIGVYNLFPPLFNYGRLPTVDQIESVIGAGFAAGIAYLSKNLFTSSDDEFMKSENKG